MKGGHDVPIHKIVSRYQKSLSNCKYLIDVVDRVYLYDNSIENADARIVARFADFGAFGKQYVDMLPRWAQYICD